MNTQADAEIVRLLTAQTGTLVEQVKARAGSEQACIRVWECDAETADDLVQLAEISLGMHDDGLPALQLIVGEHEIQVLQGALRT